MSEKKEKFALQLRNLEIVEVSIFPPEKDKPVQNNFQFNINIEHRFIIDKKLVVVQVKVDLAHERTNLGNIRTAVVFELEEFDSFIASNKSEVTLPKELINLINDVSISTTRGIMYGYFKGTHLHNAILPILNTSDFKRKD